MARRSKKQYEQKSLREKKIDFRRHLRTYLVMSVFFFVLSGLTGGGWWIWPVLGWGIGVAMQGLSLYGPLADPEDTHPTERTEEGRDAEFSGPLPDITDEEVRRHRDERELEKLRERRYRDEDLV